MKNKNIILMSRILMFLEHPKHKCLSIVFLILIASLLGLLLYFGVLNAYATYTYDQSSASFNFSSGDSFIVIPVNSPATTLGQLFPNAPSGLRILLYRNATYASYIKGSTAFNKEPQPFIKPGEGIIVRVSENGSYNVSISGSPYTSAVHISLTRQYSFIGIPYCPNNFQYSASSVIEELVDIGQGCLTILAPNHTSSAAYWYSEDPSYYPASGGIRTNFPLRRESAYWLICNGVNYTWTPACGAELSSSPPPQQQGNATTCSDSDGGKNYTLRGNTCLDNDCAEDECLPSLQGEEDLIEYFCLDGEISEEQRTCSNGCFAGACRTTAQQPSTNQTNNRTTNQTGNQSGNRTINQTYSWEDDEEIDDAPPLPDFSEEDSSSDEFLEDEEDSTASQRTQNKQNVSVSSESSEEELESRKLFIISAVVIILIFILVLFLALIIPHEKF